MEEYDRYDFRAAWSYFWDTLLRPFEHIWWNFVKWLFRLDD